MRGSHKHFLNTCKKKKALQEVVDNIDKHTIEDIQKLNTIPSWTKKYLLDIKNRSSRGEHAFCENRIAELAEMMVAASPKKNRYDTKEIRQYTGEEKYINGFLVEHGDHLFFHSSTIIKVNTHSIKCNESQYSGLLSSSCHIGHMDIIAYNEIVQKYLATKHPVGTVLNYDINSIKTRGIRYF